MDEIATKSIIIGVSIFITLFIVTVIIFEYTEISKIYKVTGETNNTFEKQLDEFNKFKDANNEFSGLDVLNIKEKYKNSENVEVCVGDDNQKCNDLVQINEEQYKYKYRAEFMDNNGMYKIVFIKK